MYTLHLYTSNTCILLYASQSHACDSENGIETQSLGRPEAPGQVVGGPNILSDSLASTWEVFLGLHIFSWNSYSNYHAFNF